MSDPRSGPGTESSVATHRRSLRQDVVFRVLTLGALMAMRLGQSVVIARALGPEGKGLLVVLLWVPELATIAVGGLSQSVTWALGKEQAAPEDLMGNALGLALVGSLLGVVVSAFVLPFMSLGAVQWWALACALLMVPMVVGVRFVQAIGMGVRWMSRVNRLHLVQSLVTFVLVALFLFGMGGGIGLVPLAMALGGLIALGYGATWLGQVSPIRVAFDLEIQRVLVAKGLMYALALVIYTLNYRVDVLLLDMLSDKVAVGLYAQGVAIIEIVLRIPGALVPVIFSHSATAEDTERFRQRTRRILTMIVPIMVLAAAGACAVAPILVPLFFGQAFEGSVPMIWALAPGIVAIGAFQIGVSDLNGCGRPQVGVYAGLVGLAFNVALNLVLIPIYGGVGAALASSVSYTVVAAIVLHVHGQQGA